MLEKDGYGRECGVNAVTWKDGYGRECGVNAVTWKVGAGAEFMSVNDVSRRVRN